MTNFCKIVCRFWVGGYNVARSFVEESGVRKFLEEQF